MPIQYDSRKSREALLIEKILNKLTVLQQTSEIEYQLILTALEAQGYPTMYKKLIRVSDRKQLEGILAVIDQVLVGQLPGGLTYSGTPADGTPATGGNPYISVAGEIVLVDGTNPLTIRLPDPVLPENFRAQVNVKMIIGPGPITMGVQGGGLIDGAVFLDIGVEHVNFTFFVVDNTYRVT